MTGWGGSVEDMTHEEPEWSEPDTPVTQVHEPSPKDMLAVLEEGITYVVVYVTYFEDGSIHKRSQLVEYASREQAVKRAEREREARARLRPRAMRCEFGVVERTQKAAVIDPLPTTKWKPAQEPVTEIVRTGKYEIVVNGYPVPANADQEARIRAMDPAAIQRFLKTMGKG